MLGKGIVLSAALLLTTIAQGDEAMNYEINLKNQDAVKAIVIKGKVAIENVGTEIGGRIELVSAYLQKHNLEAIGAPFTRTFNFADGVIEFETGFPVAAYGPVSREVTFTELSATPVALTVHTGSPEKSEAAYNAIHEWMEQNGKSPAGAPWEVYAGDDVIEIYYPVQ